MIEWDVELELDGERQTFQTRHIDDEHHLLSFGSSPLADVVIAGIAPTECWLVVNDVGYTWLRDAANETRRLAVDESFVLGTTRVRMTQAPTCSAGTWRMKFYVTRRGRLTERDIQVFHRSEVIVGRTGTSDLMLDTANASRKHCKFTVDDTGTIWITDQGSTNGTYVNGMRVAAKQRFELCDKLFIGDYVIELVEPPKRVPQ